MELQLLELPQSNVCATSCPVMRSRLATYHRKTVVDLKYQSTVCVVAHAGFSSEVPGSS
jgi:hypothetical protein